MIFKKYKTFFRVDIQLYQHECKLEKREIVWKHDARRAECFHTISRFSNFHKYGKNVLYFFYNIAQRTSTEEWREIFRVDIELYQHGS